MEIKKVFVVGAGAMGTGIAQACAASGYEVSLYDVAAPQVEKALASIAKRLDSSVAKGRITAEQKEETMARVQAAQQVEQAADCQLIIEAATEKMEIKKKIFEQLNAACKQECIMASNTSSLSITELAATTDHPERFLGMHFFNPAHIMKLLEMIPGLATDAETIEQGKKFGESLGKVVVISKDAPAFLPSRMLTMMMSEAAILLEQGNGSIEGIDQSMIYGCGHPMGPLALMDLTGVDVCLAVQETLYRELGDPRYRPTPLLRNMVRAGYLGQKTGIGFYIYDGKGGKMPNPAVDKK